MPAGLAAAATPIPGALRALDLAGAPWLEGMQPAISWQAFNLQEVLLKRGGVILDSAAGGLLLSSRCFKAPVAQLDRALPSEGRGQGFESLRVRQ